MLNELNLKLLISNRTEPSDTKVLKLRNFIKLIYKNDIEISLEEALVFPKLESLLCSSDVRLRKLSALIQCKLIKNNPTLYSEINNLPLINGKLTISQPGFIKQELLSNFLSGIQLQQNQSQSNNSKHIFHHLLQNSKEQKITTVNKSHYCNFITDGVLDHMPDPMSSIIWVEYNTQDLKKGEKKTIGFEQSTKTHITTIDVNESMTSQKNDAEYIIDKILRAQSKNSNRYNPDLNLSESRKSCYRKNAHLFSNAKQQAELRPMNNWAVQNRRKSRESSLQKLLEKTNKRVQAGNKVFTDSIEEKDIMYKIKNLRSGYGKRINHSINNSIDYSSKSKRAYDSKPASKSRTRPTINNQIFDHISIKDKIRAYNQNESYNFEESASSYSKIKNLGEYKYLFKEKRKKGINDLEKLPTHDNHRTKDTIDNSVDFSINKSINLLKDRQKIRMNKRENSPNARKNDKSYIYDNKGIDYDVQNLKSNNRNYILKDSKPHSPNIVSNNSTLNNYKNSFFAAKSRK